MIDPGLVNAAAFAKKMLSIGACKEGRDWIEAGHHADYRATWKVCPVPEFLCWLTTRTMGLEGVRACVACARAASQAVDDKLVKATVALCEQVLDNKSNDVKQLQVLAYDATESALSRRQASGSALLAAAYAAYAVHHAILAQQDTDKAASLKHLLKAAQHASDAASHAQRVTPKKPLAAVVRATVPEDVAYRAWVAATSGG